MELKFLEEELVGDCPICNNTRHVRNEAGNYVRCSCVDEFSAAKLMYKSGWNQSLILYNPANFKIKQKSQENLIQKIGEIVRNKDYSKSLFIYSISTDRDILSAILIKRLLMSNRDFKTLKKASLSELVDSYFNKTEQQQEDYSEVTIFNCDVLQLTVSEGLINSAHVSLLYSLLYDRALNGKFTVLLTNIPYAQFIKTFNDKVEYLLKEYYHFYNC